MYDRYWRLRVAGALVCGAAAVGFAAWYVAYVLPIDLRAGELAFTGILSAVDVVFVLLGIAIYQLLQAAPQRRRTRLRQEAMNGNQDAIPLARPLLSNQSDASRSDEPFEVTFASAAFQWLRVIFLVAFLVGVTWAFAAAELQEVDFSGLSAELMCPNGQAPYCAAAFARFTLMNLLLVPGSIFLVVSLLAETLGPVSTSAVHVEVRPEGLVVKMLVGRPKPFSWSEIRLLEVWRVAAQQDGFRVCAVFTRTRQISWTIADGGAKSRLTARMMSAVLSKTGLRERTFDTKLLAPDVTFPRQRFSWGEGARGRLPTVLVLLALIMAMVATLPTTAPRDRPALETGLTVLPVMLMLYLVFSFRSPKLTTSEQGGVALVSAASLDDTRFVIHPAATYEMTVGTYRAFKLNQVAGAVLGLLMALGGAALLGMEISGTPRNTYGAPWLHYSPVATVIVVGVIALGLATFLVAVRARDTIVLAESDGVRKRWMLGNVFIQWDQVNRVKRKRYWGMPGYRIVSSAPRRLIQWPIQPFLPSRKPQEPSAILTTTDQMAQVVAQRSGKARASATTDEPEMLAEMLPAEAVYEISTKTSSTNWNRAWVGGLGLFIAGSSVGLLGLEGAEYLFGMPGFHPVPLWLLLALVGAVPVGVGIIIAAMRYKSRLIVADAQGLQIRGIFGTTRILWDEIGEIRLHYVLGRPGYYVVMDDTAHRGVTWVRSVLPQTHPQTNGAVAASAAEMAQVVSQRSGQPIREVKR